MQRHDVVVVGAGIVGLATARALVQRGSSVCVIDKEPAVGAHQSSRNSGVIHSGVAYKPGSTKAKLVREGRELLVDFCREGGIPYRICGKVLVARRVCELPTLGEIVRRAGANGVDVELLDCSDLHEVEPAVGGVAGLLVPSAGVVDFAAVCSVLADSLRRSGALLRLGSEVIGIQRGLREEVVLTSAEEHRARHVVICAGLHGDRLAALAGIDTRGARIVPFRGEYFEISGPSASLVRNLVYPLPDPSLPFLGVHVTRRVGGEVEAGPNAVLALAREGYEKRDVDTRELRSLLASPAFRNLARRWWRVGARELARSVRRSAFAEEVRRLVPGVDPADLRPGRSGVRAQVVHPDGRLEDDFLFARGERVTVALNVPSPAATAALAIGEVLADRVVAELGARSSTTAG